MERNDFTIPIYTNSQRKHKRKMTKRIIGRELLPPQLNAAKSGGDEQSVASLVANISIQRKASRKSRAHKPEPDRRDEDESTK